MLLLILLLNRDTLPPLALEDFGVTGSGALAVGVEPGQGSQWLSSIASEPHLPLPDTWISALVTTLPKLGVAVTAGVCTRALRGVGWVLRFFWADAMLTLILCSCVRAEGSSGEAPRSSGARTATIFLDDGVFLKDAIEDGGLLPSIFNDTCLTLLEVDSI